MTDPTRRINLVSPPFACGVAWLVNLLLALDIRASNAGFSGHWHERGRQSRIDDKALGHLKWHLPILHKCVDFHFREAIDVAWEHRLDFARSDPCPTILFVRDPRDAIYSIYRRQYEAHYSFLEYLARPDIWPDHFPGLFGLPPFETYAYYVSFWLAMEAWAPLLVVRFEDVKADPVGMAEQVLGFLGLTRTRGEIDSAIESSSFDSARQAMAAMNRETGRDFLTARKGQPGEWRQVYDPATLARVSGPIEETMLRLGYGETSRMPPDRPDDHFQADLETLLERHLDKQARAAARHALDACLAGEALPIGEIVQSIGRDTTPEGPARHGLAAVTLAADEINRIFIAPVNDAKQAKKLALAAFLGLNFRHAAHPFILTKIRTRLYELKQLISAHC